MLKNHYRIARPGRVHQDRLDELAEKGIRLIDKEPRGGAHGADIAFLHPKSTGGVLVELCKEKH